MVIASPPAALLEVITEWKRSAGDNVSRKPHGAAALEAPGRIASEGSVLLKDPRPSCLAAITLGIIAVFIYVRPFLRRALASQKRPGGHKGPDINLLDPEGFAIDEARQTPSSPYAGET